MSRSLNIDQRHKAAKRERERERRFPRHIDRFVATSRAREIHCQLTPQRCIVRVSRESRNRQIIHNWHGNKFHPAASPRLSVSPRRIRVSWPKRNLASNLPADREQFAGISGPSRDSGNSFTRAARHPSECDLRVVCDTIDTHKGQAREQAFVPI